VVVVVDFQAAGTAAFLSVFVAADADFAYWQDVR
jgi:hypothetical protein